MVEGEAPRSDSVRAHKVPREEVGPQSVVERQSSLSTYLIRRGQRRRERFLRRARTSTIGQELLRAGYLTGCMLIDFLVVPEPIFLFGGDLGWALAAVGFVVAVGLEGWFYSKHFALPPDLADELDSPRTER